MTRLPEIANPTRNPYPSDLSDAAWGKLRKLIPQPKGVWQQMHDQVRAQLRDQLGRTKDSTVAIADAQSVKTTEKRGRYTDLMVARRLKGVSVISS